MQEEAEGIFIKLTEAANAVLAVSDPSCFDSPSD